MKPISKPPPLSEAAFQKIVIELALTLGYEPPYHTHDSRRSQPGYPDLHLWRKARPGCPGRSLYAELKSDKGKLRPAQIECINSMRLAGLEVYCWHPADWDDIVQVLSGVTPRIPDLPGQIYLFGEEEA